MSTITLPNIRVSSDLTIRLKLKDGGVAIDWSTLQNIRVSLYADDQRSMASRCSVSIDEEDSTILVCQYAANKMQYLGVNRVIVQCKYMGEVKTYDKPAFNFVRWTSDQEGEQITIDDPDVDVEISVEDVSSSILQEAVDAAFSAADRANEAAEEAEHMVDIHTGPAGKSPYIGENGHWYEWDEETHQYVDTETNAKGDTGETPDISIGTVTTVEPGTPAAASMGGTPEAPVLNLSIPKGAVGATPNFTVGTVTTGLPGTPVVITITGTAEAPVLNVTIPQGLKGDTGVSADYPITIHNGLDSDATDEALAAFQGKVLDGKVSQLEAKVDGVYPAIGLEWNGEYKEDIELSAATTKSSKYILLKAGKTYTLHAKTTSVGSTYASVYLLDASNTIIRFITIQADNNEADGDFTPANDVSVYIQVYSGSYAARQAAEVTISAASSHKKYIDDVDAALDAQITKVEQNIDSAAVEFTGTLSGAYYNLGSIVVGESYTPTTQSASGYTGIILNVAPGEYYILNTSDNTAYSKCYALLDGEGKVLSFRQAAANGLGLQIPENAAQLIVNTKVVVGQKFVTKVFGQLARAIDLHKIDEVSVPLVGEGQYFNLSGIIIGEPFTNSETPSAVGYGYCILKVFAGEKYHIKTGGNTVAAKSYAILDKNYIVLDFVQSAGERDVNITTNGYLIVNSTITNYSLVLKSWQHRVINKLREYILDDVFMASIFDIARFNNNFRFDRVETDDLYAGTLRLGYERQLPREGSAINVDAELSYGLDGTTAMDDVRKRIVPYLYWNQQKVGTIVLYDNDGNPYMYDKNGNKKTIVTE